MRDGEFERKKGGLYIKINLIDIQTICNVCIEILILIQANKHKNVKSKTIRDGVMSGIGFKQFWGRVEVKCR